MKFENVDISQLVVVQFSFMNRYSRFSSAFYLPSRVFKFSSSSSPLYLCSSSYNNRFCMITSFFSSSKTPADSSSNNTVNNNSNINKSPSNKKLTAHARKRVAETPLESILTLDPINKIDDNTETTDERQAKIAKLSNLSGNTNSNETNNSNHNNNIKTSELSLPESKSVSLSAPVSLSDINDNNWVEHLEFMLDEQWRQELSAEFTKPYWAKLKSHLKEELTKTKVTNIYPPYLQIFRAFQLCSFQDVKVVILGQDPYFSQGQAEGLCFSVPPSQAVPSSLRNIYKELQSDLGQDVFTKPKHGNLVNWATQGVMLLNATLTVRSGLANSHAKFGLQTTLKFNTFLQLEVFLCVTNFHQVSNYFQYSGWNLFTDAVIKAISKDLTGVVFLLWGNYAQSKEKLINTSKHYILKTVHPSGLSADRGFFGCKHFSRTNKLLEKQGKATINWQV